jgi:hypothetical protein
MALIWSTKVFQNSRVTSPQLYDYSEEFSDKIRVYIQASLMRVSQL